MYEVHVLQGIAQSGNEFSKYFVFYPLPVPNLGLVAPLWILSQAVSLETAAKIYLSLCVLTFPWSFWYAVRSIAGRETPYSYLGFPYLLNLYVFSGQAYLLGLISFFLCTGYFVPRLTSMKTRSWVLLFVCLQVMYFIHAITWLLALFVLGAVLARTPTNKGTLLRKLAAVALPAVGLLVWYALSDGLVTQQSWGIVSGWSVHSLARNLLKPMGLLIKSYGVTSRWPLTLINGVWIVLLGVAVVRRCRAAGLRGIIQSPFFVPSAVCVIFAATLGTYAFDVYQPGARLILPAYFLATLTLGNVSERGIWSGAFLVVCAVVCIYNFSFFEIIDARAKELFSDIDSTSKASEPMYVITLDWPADTGVMDIGSASVNPLSLIPYYRRLTDGGVAWIFGTALVRLRPEWGMYRPQIGGENRREYVRSVVDHLPELMFFSRIVVIGSNDESRQVANLLHQQGFESRLVRPLWTIFVRAESGRKGSAGGSFSTPARFVPSKNQGLWAIY
jgi:hypothetical protein